MTPMTRMVATWRDIPAAVETPLIRSAVPVAGTISIAAIPTMTIMIVVAAVAIVMMIVPAIVAAEVAPIMITVPTLVAVVIAMVAVVATTMIAVVVSVRGGHCPRQQRHCHGSSKQGLHIVSSLRRNLADLGNTISQPD
jgi:hypothetical protein